MPHTPSLFWFVAAALALGCSNNVAPSADADLGGDGGAAGAGGAESLGATVDPGGVTFRVWAPGAEAAAVSGDFSAAPVALARDGSETFGGRVAGARAGQRYRYLITARDGTVLTREDPRGRQRDGGSSVIVDPARYAWQSAPFQRPGKNALVVMELHVGSFSCPGEPAQCRFPSVAQRLPEIAGLGVNVIELMPANGFGSQRGWGYNPQAYFAPQPTYGSPDDLRGLVDAAHQAGVAVVLDVVYNHYDNWNKAPLFCFDGDCPDGWSGVYFFKDQRYRGTPWGPRFDYVRGPVADFIVDSVRQWREEYRVDGFRWDSVANIRALDGTGIVPGGPELLRRSNAAAREQPGALLIAEDLKGWSGVTDASERGGMGFDGQWDAGFHAAVTGAVLGYDDSARNIDAVRDALYGRYNGDPFQRVIYTEDHDTVGNGHARLPSQIDPANPVSFAARKRSMLAAAVMLTAPGVPMLFQGQEMLAVGGFADPPAPLDWSLRQTQAGVVAFYKDMIALRRNLSGHTAGLLGSNINVFHVHQANKVLAYQRWAGADSDVVVVANFTNRSYTRYDVGLPSGGTWRVRMNSDEVKYSADFGGAPSSDVVALATPRDGLPFTGPVALGPYAVVVLSK